MHGVFILIAMVSLLRQPRSAIAAVIMATPIALIYVFGDLLAYAAMVIIFAMSLPIIWAGLLSVVARRDYRFLLILALISMIPALLSLPTLLEGGLFDSKYGRPRMLLGYYHPKEAAISFAVPILLAMQMARSVSVVPWLFGFAFLWMVGSRNVALIIFLAWALRWHGRLFLASLLTGSLVLLLWIVSSNDWYNMIDHLSSTRLSLWTDALNTAHELKGLDVASGERFGTDNFFVEALAISGFWAIPLILIWVVVVSLVLWFRSPRSSWPRVSFAMLIFTASFDTGIASTGNIMHVLLWAVMLSPLFQRRSTQPSVSLFVKNSLLVPVGKASI
jgi:hypothetical protein